MSDTPARSEPNAGIKHLVDYGPLVVFFLAIEHVLSTLEFEVSRLPTMTTMITDLCLLVKC